MVTSQKENFGRYEFPASLARRVGGRIKQHFWPDLIIRISGEQRMSGFMPCQASHSEFWFTKTFFPELRRKDLFEAIEEFSQRERPFGK